MIYCRSTGLACRRGVVTEKIVNRDRYLIKSILHAAEFLKAFQTQGEILRLKDLITRTGFSKGMTFRLAFTLERCGLIEKVGDNQYRSFINKLKQRQYRFGYAAEEKDHPFWGEVSKGLRQAAENLGIELIAIDNRPDHKVALRNADLLIRESVDLVIEFQTDELIAPMISAKYREANIPLIAVEVPHPGATYFGANNYEAGLIGGRYLMRWAKQYWQGVVDEIIFLELPRAGPLPRSRLTGMLMGIREGLRQADGIPVTYLNGDGRFGTSLEVVRKHLRQSASRHTLVGAINDPSALGALRAFEEAGRAHECAVMGQNAGPDARAELRRKNSRLIGSVGYFPEKYGEGLVRLAEDILEHRPTPPAVFVKHQLITSENVGHYYPNDALLLAATV